MEETITMVRNIIINPFLPDCKINQFVKFIYKKKILTVHIKTKNVNNQVNINCNGTYYFCPKFENGKSIKHYQQFRYNLKL